MNGNPEERLSHHRIWTLNDTISAFKVNVIQIWKHHRKSQFEGNEKKNKCDEKHPKKELNANIKLETIRERNKYVRKLNREVNLDENGKLNFDLNENIRTKARRENKKLQRKSIQ